MTNLPLDAPVTRREFYLSMTIVWLFIVLVSVATIPADARWTALILPVGALGILLLHVVALRRRPGASRGPGDPTS